MGLIASGIVALLVLIVAAAVLAYRRRRRRRRRRAERMQPPALLKGGSLSQLADTLLGTQAMPPLALAGPAAARITQALGGEAVAAPTMATMLWEAFVVDERFAEALRQTGASDRALRECRTIVVRHARGARYDLMVFDPGYSGEPTGRDIELGAMASALWRRPLSWRTLLDRRRGLWAGLDEDTVVGALGEIAVAGRFGMVIAASPEMVPTRSPSPAWGISTIEGHQPVATVGAVVQTADGSVGVTTALHAVRRDASVSVHGHPGRVTSAHEPTDSCLVSVPGLSIDGQARGAAGCLHGASPSEERVTFDGLASGLKTTFVQGWTTNIHSEQNVLAAMVFTDPDTSSGDSGAALVDSQDRIIGFAAYRSGIGEPKQHSAWVWADQVLRVHQVRPVSSSTDA